MKRNCKLKKEARDKNYLSLSPRAFDYVLIDKKTKKIEGEDEYYHNLLRARAKLPITPDEETEPMPTFNRAKTSLATLVYENHSHGIDLSLLTERLIYQQNLSEINILNFQIRQDTNQRYYLRKVNLFDFFAAEEISFLRFPLSFGGGISYSDNLGLSGEAKIGILYKNKDLIYLPFFRLNGNKSASDFSPGLEFLYFTKFGNWRLNLDSRDVIVEAMAIVGRFSINLGYSFDRNYKSDVSSIGAGIFF